jgi:D-3-phosphoglycerate dehydrogenase
MPSIKIVRTDRELECPVIDRVLREKGAELVLLPEGICEDELVREVADADLLLMCYTPITAKVINGAPKLKAIVKYGVGIDAIDIPAARARSIPVVNIPEYAEETVAEGAFTLMIALAKKLLPISRQMTGEGWAWPEQNWLGSDIAGKTVGLVGVGKIGRSMARMAGAGFRARVLGYDPHVSAEVMAQHGVAKVTTLEELLPQCDFVSLHSVLNDGSRHVIGAAELELMKPSAFLINVSRGALIDEMALLAALKAGKIAGCGLDVYSQEPLDHGRHPLRELFKMDNVILFPHLTFYTKEAMDRLEEDTLDRCLEALDGKPILVRSKDPRLMAQTVGVRFT